jgi:hypothetical protein
MPNWCYNHIEVFDVGEDKKERDRFFSEEEFAITTPLQKYLPMSEYHQTMEGYNDGGYSWCYDNWGTKWPENDLTLIDKEYSLDFSFDSPWGPPIIGYQKISAMFPELFFLHYYQEDGMCFSGSIIYHQGSQVFVKEYDHNDWPEWLPEYEDNPDPYYELVTEKRYQTLGEAQKVLEKLLHIE